MNFAKTKTDGAKYQSFLTLITNLLSRLIKIAIIALSSRKLTLKKQYFMNFKPKRMDQPEDHKIPFKN